MFIFPCIFLSITIDIWTSSILQFLDGDFYNLHLSSIVAHRNWHAFVIKIPNATFGYNRGLGLGLIFNCSCLSPNKCYTCFLVTRCDTYVPSRRCYHSFQFPLQDIILFPYTYEEYTKGTPGIQIL
jgi:hypothetical protein